MNRSAIEHKGVSRTVDSNCVNTRLTGSWLITARVVWLALVIPSLGLYTASLIVSYQQMQTMCTDLVKCSNLPGALTPQLLQALLSIGISGHGFAILSTIFNAITAAIWYGVGFLIFWRRSDDWLALLGAFVLVMFNVTSLSKNNVPFTLVIVYPAVSLALSLIGFLGGVSLGLFFLLFPNGRLEPRWMRLIMLIFIIQVFFDNFPSPISTFDADWPGQLKLLITLVTFGSIIFSQIYRYRRVSTLAIPVITPSHPGNY